MTDLGSANHQLRPHNRRRLSEQPTASYARVQDLGGDLVGVDLLPLERGYTVIELNGAVDFEPSYALPGQDINKASPPPCGSTTDRPTS